MDMSEYGVQQADLLQHNAIARRHFETLYEIKKYIRIGLYDGAHEAWEEIPQDDQIVLNRAWTKGGFLTPQERQIAVKGLDAATGWVYGVAPIYRKAESGL
jgi:hypothetical protein